MLSKNKIKYIHSLELKKYRKEEKAFVAEGHKLVGDLIGHFHCRLVVATREWLEKQPDLQAEEILEVNKEELYKASLQKTPQEVVAVFSQPTYTIDFQAIRNSLCLALDDIQDPGNLGTIVRLADWFGIEHIFCSPNTADIYNPKAIQATMGGIARVKLYYERLPELIEKLKGTPIYGTFLNGNSLYDEKLTPNGLILMGNEGNGISKEVEKLITRQLYIPSFPRDRETSESLNVAIATAVICSEFRRRTS